MKIVFISNYLSHHQIPFCCEMVKIYGDNFSFIAMQKMSDERLSMGWHDEKQPYEIRGYEMDKYYIQNILISADVVIYGGLDYGKLFKLRVNTNKLTFLYTERIHKDGYNKLKLIKHFPQYYFQYGKHKNLYCLCAGAFVSNDFHMTRTFNNKCFKWGYFPSLDTNSDRLYSKQNIKILFVSRLISWKHPETPIYIAKKLKALNYSFKLTIIGRGEMSDFVEREIRVNDLNDYVSIIESIPFYEVRDYMKNSDIFLFTSDRQEGWGVVLNEAMNSGCAVVAGSQIGSVPFLIDDNVNGLIFNDTDAEDAFNKVKLLFDNNDLIQKIGRNARDTIRTQWNPLIASQRFNVLMQNLLQKKTNVFNSGVCSKAELIKDDWYENK